MNNFINKIKEAGANRRNARMEARTARQTPKTKPPSTNPRRAYAKGGSVKKK